VAECLYRVTAPYFVAGFVATEAGTVTRSAPILKWARGKTTGEVVKYCLGRRWGVEYLRGKDG
jgi:hypothetical protein